MCERVSEREREGGREGERERERERERNVYIMTSRPWRKSRFRARESLRDLLPVDEVRERERKNKESLLISNVKRVLLQSARARTVQVCTVRVQTGAERGGWLNVGLQSLRFQTGQ